ncbi:protease [Chitinophaga sp. SYP-B3965]|uniref:protease n=1 Tax=Chitinophaga sp. SYP-B3965 TaxID=2663120 RepID=UPI001299EE3B|nr:protease [Chitinophaga sp. SYP-B3965]MRG44129.1 protease [Chitinophaga sp. SYP-B3965]
MRNLLLLLTACFTFTACGNMQKTTTTTNELVTEMSLPETVKTGSPILLKFTVRNPSAQELKFCKWHTPFEGFMGMFLDITDASGTNAQYKGIMAKRIMPPPEEAYIKVLAGDSVSVEIDLLKGYNITAPGKYKVVYQAGGMSGLVKVNEPVFNVTN